MIGQAIAWPAIRPKMLDPLQRGVDAGVAFFLLVVGVRTLWNRGRLPARHTGRVVVLLTHQWKAIK